MNLMIAIPSLDFMHVSFIKSLLILTRRLREHNISYDIQFCSGTLVYIARDELAEKAMYGDYTHVLWLDADVVFPADTVDRLARHNFPLVSGAYVSRRPPYQPCVFTSLSPPKRVEQFPDKLFRIEGCGFGCILMDAQVLRKVYLRADEKWFQPTDALGEDLAFCERALKAGYSIYCDPTAKVGHIGHITIWPDAAETMRGLSEKESESA